MYPGSWPDPGEVDDPYPPVMSWIWPRPQPLRSLKANEVSCGPLRPFFPQWLKRFVRYIIQNNFQKKKKIVEIHNTSKKKKLIFINPFFCAVLFIMQDYQLWPGGPIFSKKQRVITYTSSQDSKIWKLIVIVIITTLLYELF